MHMFAFDFVSITRLRVFHILSRRCTTFADSLKGNLTHPLYVRAQGKTLSGKTALEVKVAPQETTKVLPGAVSDDNKLAFNPANVRVNVTATAVPYVFVTDLKTKKVLSAICCCDC